MSTGTPIIVRMVMGEQNLSRTAELTWLSVQAGVQRLIDLRIWPRPARARVLRLGHDIYYNDLKDIPEAGALVEHLLSDDLVRSIYFGERGAPSPWLFYEYWKLLLLRILAETKGVLPTKQVFHMWFRRFIKEIYSPNALWRTIDTVSGLQMAVKTLRLDSATSVVSIPPWGSTRERRLWGPNQYPVEGRLVPDGWTMIGMDKVLVVTTFSSPKADYFGSMSPYPHLMSEIERPLAFQDAVRLMKSGVPRLHAHAKFHVSRFPLDETSSWTRDYGELGLYETEAIIGRSDLRRVSRLWHDLMHTQYEDPSPLNTKVRPLNIAFGGFARSYEVLRSWTSLVVDMTIALESMFSPRDNQELSHRIALRVSWLICPPCKSHKTIYEQVRTMYDIRSRRVHGDIPSKKDIDNWLRVLSGHENDQERELERVNAALETARHIVRCGLCACMRLQQLDSTGPHWPLPKDFDHNMVTTGQRIVWQKSAGIRSLPTRSVTTDAK